MGKYSDNPNLELKVNTTRARELAEKIISMMQNREYPFNIDNLFPDAIVPNGIRPGTIEHALFLFYGCSVDSMTQTKQQLYII